MLNEQQEGRMFPRNGRAVLLLLEGRESFWDCRKPDFHPAIPLNSEESFFLREMI